MMKLIFNFVSPLLSKIRKRAEEKAKMHEAVNSNKDIVLVVFTLDLNDSKQLFSNKAVKLHADYVKARIYGVLTKKFLPKEMIIENTELEELSLILIGHTLDSACNTATEIIHIREFGIMVSAGIAIFYPNDSAKSFRTVNHAASIVRKNGTRFGVGTIHFEI